MRCHQRLGEHAFPVRARASGLSSSHNTTVALFGGFTPTIAATPVEAAGSPVAPGYYLPAMALLGITALAAGVRTRRIR